jgi:hypothetical protein
VSGVTAPDPDAIMDRGRETLREIFGFDDFLPSQAASLVAILASRDVLAVMPLVGSENPRFIHRRRSWMRVWVMV